MCRAVYIVVVLEIGLALKTSLFFKGLALEVSCTPVLFQSWTKRTLEFKTCQDHDCGGVTKF